QGQGHLLYGEPVQVAQRPDYGRTIRAGPARPGRTVIAVRAFGEKRDTNQTYGETITALGAENEKIVAIEADLMKASGSAPFKERFPERMFNVGIAEQNALSFSAGLA